MTFALEELFTALPIMNLIIPVCCNICTKNTCKFLGLIHKQITVNIFWNLKNCAWALPVVLLKLYFV